MDRPGATLLRSLRDHPAAEFRGQVRWVIESIEKHLRETEPMP